MLYLKHRLQSGITRDSSLFGIFVTVDFTYRTCYHNYMSDRKEKGQILLIVVLVIIVASTIGLSIASRAITSLRTSTEEAESQKALAAAEAGIERAIQSNVIATGLNILNDNLSNKSDYKVNVVQVDSSTFLINGGTVIPKDEGADVWVVSHDSNNNPIYSEARSLPDLNLYWGSSSEACGTSTAPAAIQAIAISRDKTTGEISSHRYAYDSCSDRRAGNNFTQAESGISYIIDDVTFNNKTPLGSLVNNVNDVVFIRVIPIYKDTTIGLSACDGAGNCTSLPSQGYVISSTGTSPANSPNAAVRTITVFKGYPQTYLPYLSYGLFVAN